MNYTMYMSASGLFSSLKRMDTAANNLANSETPGFKADLDQLLQRDAQRIEDGTMGLPSDDLLERLGAGVKLGQTKVHFAQGIIQNTTNPLDVAVNGDGFFMIAGPGGETKLSRDGRFTLNNSGELVQAGTGYKVLSGSGSNIQLNGSSNIVIDQQGSIRQNGVEVGKLGFVNVEDTESLRKEGNSLFSMSAGGSTQPATGTIVHKAIERSSVDPVKAMLAISDAQRSVENASKMLMISDEMLQRVTSTFGRLA